MANDITKNDWLVANLTSPNNTLGDFAQEGLTADNIQLLSKEDYKKNSKIQEVFADKEGQFDEGSFDKFYDQAKTTYNVFANDQFDKSVLNNSYYHEANIHVPKESRRLRNGFIISKEKNPFGTVAGVSGLKNREASNLSIREIAQTQKIWNPVTDSFEEETPNDWGFWRSSFKEPLAIAQWDADGEHYDKELGRDVKHTKGEYRFNDAGKPYYERLNYRAPYGKDILSPWDVLTIDGSAADKWNFMSSDDKQKTLTGTVMKTVAQVVPYFIPGVGQYYTYVTLGNAILTDLLPVLSKSTAGVIFGDTMNNSDFYKAMSGLEGWNRKWRSSTSDEAKESMFNKENFLGLVTDVFGQLAQQRAIAKIPIWLGNTKKEAKVLEEASKIGGVENVEVIRQQLRGAKTLQEKSAILRQNFGSDKKLADIMNKIDTWSSTTAKNLGVAYMAGISSTGIVEEAKLLGLDERDTAALFIGSLVGLGTLMSKADFGHWALKGLGIDEVSNFLKSSIKERAKAMTPTIQKFQKMAANTAGSGTKEVGMAVSEEATKKNFWMSLMNTGKNIGESVSKRFEKIINGDISSIKDKMFAEGLEEVSEEALQDSIKVVYNGLKALGWTSSDPSKTQYFDFDDLAARYVMAGIGGAIGGGIAGVQDVVGGKVHSSLPESLKKELTSIVLHGYGDQFKDKLKKMHQNGELGPTALSPIVEEGLDFKLTNDTIYKPTAEHPKNLSQNDLVYDLINAEIDFIKSAIFQEGLDNVYTNAPVYEFRENQLLDFKHTTAIEEDISFLVDKILQKKAQIAEIEGGIKDATQAETQANKLQAGPLKSELEQLKEQLNEITSGQKLQYYTERALFDTQPKLRRAFGIRDKEDFALATYKKPYKDLTDDEKAELDLAYDEYLRKDKRHQSEIAFTQFKAVQEMVNPALEQIAKYARQKSALNMANFDYVETLSNLLALNQTPNKETGEGESGAEIATNLSTPELLLRTQVDTLEGIDPNSTFNDLIKGYMDVLRTSEYVHPDLARYLKNVLHKPITTRLEVAQGDDTKAIITVDGVLLELLNNKVSSINENFTGDSIAVMVEDYIEKNKSKLNTWSINEFLEGLRTYQFLPSNYDAADPESVRQFFLDNVFSVYGEQIEEGDIPQFQAAIQESIDDLEETFYANAYFDEGKQLQYYPSDASNIIRESVKLSEELQGLMDSKSNNPLIDLVNQLTAVEGDTGKREIYEVIGNLFDDIAQTSASEFVIENKIDEDQLNNALKALNQVSAAIFASSNFAPLNEAKTHIIGYNAAVNNVSVTPEGFEPLPMMEASDAATLIGNEVYNLNVDPEIGDGGDLGILKNRIKFLLTLSDYNKNGTIRENKLVGARTMTLYLGSLAPGSDNFEMLKKRGVDLTEIETLFDQALQYQQNMDSIFSPEETPVPFENNDEAFTKLRAEKDKIEEALYKAVNERDDKIEIIKGLIEDIDLSKIDIDDDINLNSKTSHIPRLQEVMHLFQSITINPKQFYDDLTSDNIDSLNDLPYAPFYIQELALKQAYWSVMSKFNKDGLDTYYMMSDKVLPILNAPYDKRIPNYRNTEDMASVMNAIFINGIPGAGKTTTVVNFLNSIVNKYGLNSAIYAPFDEQVSNLTASLNTRDNVINDGKGTLDNLFESILGKELYNTIQSDLEKLTATYDLNSTVFVNNWGAKATREELKKKGEVIHNTFSYDTIGVNFTNSTIAKFLKEFKQLNIEGKIPNLIVIDEATHIPGPLLELLSVLVLTHNENSSNKVSIILSGDTEQGSKELEILSDGKPIKIESNLKLMNVLKTPTLDQSLRSNYNVINDNIKTIRAFLHSTIEIIDSGVDPKSVSKDLQLKYKNHAGKLIGHKVVDEVDETEIMGIVNSSSERVAIITNKNPLKYVDILNKNEVDSEKYVILAPENAQGLEFEHVIVDIDPVVRSYQLTSQNKYPFGKDLAAIYTSLSRAKTGAVINKKSSHVIKLSSTSDNVEPYLVKLDPALISDYKRFTIESIKNSYSNLEGFESNFTISPKETTLKPTTVTQLDNEQANALLQAAANALAGSTATATDTVDTEGVVSTIPFRNNAISYLNHEKLGIYIDNNKNLIKEYPEQFSDISLLQDILQLDDNDLKQQLAHLRRQLKTIKTGYLAYHINPEAQQRDLPRFLEQVGVESQIVQALEDIGDYELKLYAKPFASKFDTLIAESSGGTGNTSYLVLVDPKSLQQDGSYTRFITLSAMPRVSNPKVPQEVRDWLTSLYSKIQNKKPVFFSFKPEKKITDILKPISNLLFEDKGKKLTNLKEFVRENSHLVVSNPFIIVNDIYTDAKQATSEQKEKGLFYVNAESNPQDYNTLSGRAAVFVSYDKSLTKSVEKLKNEWFKQLDESRKHRETNDFYPGTVRMLMLNARGRKFSDWLAYNEELLKNKFEKDLTVSDKDLRPASNNYAAARILARLTLILHNYQTVKSNREKLTNMYLPKNFTEQDIQFFIDKVESLMNVVIPATVGKNWLGFISKITGTELAKEWTAENQSIDRSSPSDTRSNDQKREDAKRALESFFNENRGGATGSITKIQQKYYPELGDQGYFFAREHFLAAEILNIISDPESIKDIDFTDSDLELNADNSIIDKKSMRAALRNMVAAIRVGFNGGILKDDNRNVNISGIFGNSTKDDPVISKEKEKFLSMLDDVLTGDKSKIGNYRALFPDGVHQDILLRPVSESNSYSAGAVPFNVDTYNRIDDFVIDVDVRLPKLGIDLDSVNMEGVSESSSQTPSGGTTSLLNAFKPVIQDQIISLTNFLNKEMTEFDPSVRNALNDVFIDFGLKAKTDDQIKDVLLEKGLPVSGTNMLNQFSIALGRSAIEVFNNHLNKDRIVPFQKEPSNPFKALANNYVFFDEKDGYKISRQYINKDNRLFDYIGEKKSENPTNQDLQGIVNAYIDGENKIALFKDIYGKPEKIATFVYTKNGFTDFMIVKGTTQDADLSSWDGWKQAVSQQIGENKMLSDFMQKLDEALQKDIEKVLTIEEQMILSKAYLDARLELRDNPELLESLKEFYRDFVESKKC